MDNKQLHKIIHDDLLPMVQMFHSFGKLANDRFLFSAKHFQKAALKIQEIINILRGLAKEEK